MKKILKENRIKRYARHLLREGEVESAESILACKDQVDRLQDSIEEIGKMVNDELPKLIDKIRATFGLDQADKYQQTANTILSDLLTVLKEKKTALEQAVLVLTGDAREEGGPQTDLGLPEEPETGEDVSGNELDDFAPKPGKTAASPLGREPRLPAEESRKLFNKKLSDAKIVALQSALNETNVKKFPIKARRLAEELRRVVTIAIKEEAKNVKKSSKKATANSKKKKPAWLTTAEEKAEKKEGKTVKEATVKSKFDKKKNVSGKLSPLSKIKK